jgi:Haem-binding domain
VAVPGQVQSVLRRSCYNCHSSETVWPWYSHVAPVSWLVADDVNTARSHINFQDWEAQVNASEGNEHLGLICKEIREGTMPPRSYRLMHKDAHLSADDVNTVCTWSQTFATPDDTDKKAD